MYTLFLILFVSSCLNAEATETQTVIPLADTCVQASSPDSSEYGLLDYLKVQETTTELSLTFLMFDLSGVAHSSNVSFGARLRLRSIYVSLPFLIGVRWCVNNAWSEDTLTFADLSYFSRTAHEGIIMVSSANTWYEWTVTEFVRAAIQQNYEKITLVLETYESGDGNFLAMFRSKDQQDPLMNEYKPQLVFTQQENGIVSPPDMTGMVVLGVFATVGISFVAYKFLKKSTRKIRRFSSVK